MTKRYTLLDLDRCLLNTNALHMVFDEIVRNMSVVDVNDIINAKKVVEEESGGSFDTAGFIQTELKRLGKEDKWKDIEANFIAASKNYDYLMPGARDLLYTLNAHNEDYGIITFGGSTWQNVKIRAAGIGDIPHFITGEKNKGYLVSGWLSAGLLPDALGAKPFDEVVMVDDKVASFNGFPPSNAKGYQVRTGKDIDPNPVGLPLNVNSIENLHHIIKLIEDDKY